MTQADMACVAIADSRHSKFIVICLSNGASNLYMWLDEVTTSRSQEIPTEKWKDMMTVSGTILSTYFAIEIAEISKEGEVSPHFLHLCVVVELMASIQGTRVTALQ